MAIPQEFYDALNKDDVTSIRIIMKNSLLLDRTFTDFKKMQQDAAKLPNLYQPFNNQDLTQDKSQWTKDYMNRQLAQLMTNFCPERIEYVQNIIRYVYPQTEDKTASSSAGSSTSFGRDSGAASGRASGQSSQGPSGNVPYHEQKKRDMQKGLVTKVVYCGGGGAIIGAAIGAMTGTSVGAGLGLGGAVGIIAGLIIHEVGR